MNELKPYIPKIKEYFADIINKHSLSFKSSGDHEVRLIGEKCTIEFTTQRYYADLQVVFIGRGGQVEVTVGKILEDKKLLGKKILNESEVKACEALADEIESGIFSFSLIIKKYFENVLDGSYFND